MQEFLMKDNNGIFYELKQSTMKTAMQEVLDKIQFIFHKEVMDEKEWWAEFKQKYLEKEKEQIMNAYCDGAKGGANGTKGQHEFGWVSRHTRNKYYNQTYNQNK